MPDNDEERRKAIAAAYNRMYYAKNREQIAAKAHERYQKNRAEILEKRRDYIAEWHKAHPEAVLANKRRYREKNRDKLREAHRKYIRDETGALSVPYRQRLKIKTAKWRQDLETMAGRPRPKFCEVCDRPPDNGKSLHYDHCHDRGHFRGWICRGCNLTLGYVNHDPALLLKLHAYLIHTKDGAVTQSNLQTEV